MLLPPPLKLQGADPGPHTFLGIYGNLNRHVFPPFYKEINFRGFLFESLASKWSPLFKERICSKIGKRYQSRIAVLLP